VPRAEVFFYGLFMDEALLRAKGVDPQQPRRASLKGFELRIGQRATLVASAAATVHGVLASISQRELDALYSDPGVREYRPEQVSVDVGDRQVSAQCYMLPAARWSDAPNPEYAARLRALAQKLGLPPQYIASIR
jgi:hypothetical protein